MVSSDLSHYPRAADAETIDHETIAAVLDGRPENFDRVSKLSARDRHIPQLHTRACGAAAISTGLFVAHILGLKRSKLLAYAHSGDTSGDRSRVVGYASIWLSQ